MYIALTVSQNESDFGWVRGLLVIYVPQTQFQHVSLRNALISDD